MFRHIKISNFKSLDIDLDLTNNGVPVKLGILIGINGSGKSSILQSVDFLGQLVRGQISNWLESREWKSSELVAHKVKRNLLISFSVELQLDNDKIALWEGSFNTSAAFLRCTKEQISIDSIPLLKSADGIVSIKEKSYDGLAYEGSALSCFKFTDEGEEELREIKDKLYSIKSLELLSPQQMRKRARPSDDLGIGGEKLAGYLAKINFTHKEEILSHLQTFYNHLQNYRITSPWAGWRGITFTEDYKYKIDLPDREISRPYNISSRHINDGILRILAILSQVHSNRSTLLFDEIENGMNPEIISKLVTTLQKASPQVIITTHSPVILNYLTDEDARACVNFVYRLNDGRTKCQKFYEIPDVANKLEILGPGEVYLDCFLEELAEHLSGE